MLKKPLAVVVILSLVLLAVPAMATASTGTNALRISSPLFTDLFEAWTSFWGSLLGGDEAPANASVQEKNGCGIDPNGNPLCGGLIGATPNSDPGSETQGSGN